MTPEVGQWLTRFAAGAGTLFDWHLSPDGVLLTDSEGWQASTLYMCPVSAEATLETGTFYSACAVVQAGDLMGLSCEAVDALMRASDDYEDADQTIRTSLLRICRVPNADNEGVWWAKM